MVLDVLTKPSAPFITKVMPPKRPYGLVRRERLLHTLSRAMDRHRMALVTAPAGYGKTSLVSDFLADVTAPVCWYSIEPEDNGVRSFLHFLVTAIKQRFPRFGEGTLHLLNTSPDLGSSLPSVIGALVSEIQDQIPDWFVLVLEDVHWCSDPVILSAIDLLLRHLPESCFVIITSRNQPRLSALSRFSAQRSITRITTRDLAFKEDEVVELLAVSGHRVDSEVTRKLAGESEGWIAGIILLTPWLDEPPALARLDSGYSHDDLFQYLSEDIFQRLPDRWRDFLVRTSVVADVSVDLCIEALGFDDAAVLLRSMDGAGLFISEFDDGNTYRYHALFREFLAARARVDAVQLAATRRSVATFYADHGRWADGVSQFLAGGCADDAADVLSRGAPELYQGGEWAQLAELIDNVEGRRGNFASELTLWRGRCLVQIGDPDTALGLVERFDRAHDGDAPDMATALAEIVRSGALRSRGSIDDALMAARRALWISEHAEEESDEAVVSLLCAEAHQYIGACLAVSGRSEDAITELDAALELFTKQGNIYQTAKTQSVLGNALYRIGRYSAAIAQYEKAIDGSRKIGNVAVLASALNNLGNLYISLGSFGLAQDVLRSALEAARKVRNTRIEAYATQSLGDALAGLMCFEEAAEVLRDAIQLCQRSGETVLEARTRLGLARVCARLQSFDEADSLLNEAAIQMNLAPTPYGAGVLAFSQAIPRMMVEDFWTARRLLTAALEQFDIAGDMRWRERTALLLAQATFRAGDAEAAAGCLQRVREAARSDVGPAALRQEASLAGDVLRFAVEKLPGGDAFVHLCSAADAASLLPGELVKPVAARPTTKPVVKAFGLGNFTIELDGCALDDAIALPPKAKELLFYLLSSGRQMRREEIRDALWPEVDPSKDSSVLRTNVYRLRKVLYDDCIIVEGDSYRMDPAGHFWLDLHYFKELVQRAQQSRCSPVERQLLLETAVQMYQGSFLDSVSSEWCEAERYDVEVRFASASLALAEMYLSGNQAAKAVPLCEQVLARDPYSEEAMLLLARAHVDQGDRTAASLHWKAFQRRFQTEMGDKPSRDAVARFRELVHS